MSCAALPVNSQLCGVAKEIDSSSENASLTPQAAKFHWAMS